MDKWRGKVAVVTGASSGIGEAITKKLVHHGVTVVGLARRSERIETLSKDLAAEPGKLISIKTDLRKEEEIFAAFSRIEEEFGGADVLVNNSGVADTGRFLGHMVSSGRAPVYQASKHAVTAICKSLRNNLAEEGSTIKVTSVSPGFTNTEIVQRRVNSMTMLEREDVAEVVIGVLSASPVSQICEVVLTPVPAHKKLVY